MGGWIAYWPKVQRGRLFTAGPVERARGWGSRKPQLTCPCLDSGRSTLKRHVRQRLGCRAGPSPGHSTNPFWSRCWPFCSGSGDAGQSGTAPTYLASGFLLRAPLQSPQRDDTARPSPKHPALPLFSPELCVPWPRNSASLRPEVSEPGAHIGFGTDGANFGVEAVDQRTRRLGRERNVARF